MRPYHPYPPDQADLLPISLAQAIPPEDPVHAIRTLVPRLDLSVIHAAYQTERGRPPLHPQAMVGLLLYGACCGIYSSRQLAQACRDRLTFLYLTGRASLFLEAILSVGRSTSEEVPSHEQWQAARKR